MHTNNPDTNHLIRLRTEPGLFWQLFSHSVIERTVDISLLSHRDSTKQQHDKNYKCGPMPNVMVALPNTGGALGSMLQSLADAHY